MRWVSEDGSKRKWRLLTSIARKRTSFPCETAFLRTSRWKSRTVTHGCLRRNTVKLRSRRLFSKGSLPWNNFQDIQLIGSRHVFSKTTMEWERMKWVFCNCRPICPRHLPNSQRGHILAGLHTRANLSTFLEFKRSEGDEAGGLLVRGSTLLGAGDRAVEGEATTLQVRRMFIWLFFPLKIALHIFDWASCALQKCGLGSGAGVHCFTEHLKHGVDGIFSISACIGGTRAGLLGGMIWIPGIEEFRCFTRRWYLYFKTSFGLSRMAIAKKSNGPWIVVQRVGL